MTIGLDLGFEAVSSVLNEDVSDPISFKSLPRAQIQLFGSNRFVLCFVFEVHNEHNTFKSVYLRLLILESG